MLDGTGIGECVPRHRHREFLRFLKTIDERTQPNLGLHLIVDNYAGVSALCDRGWPCYGEVEVAVVLVAASAAVWVVVALPHGLCRLLVLGVYLKYLKSGGA
jgi:hypothetical protein